MICNSYKPIFYSHGIERLIYNLMEIKCLKKAGTGQQIHHQDIQRMWRNLCAPGTRLKMKMLAIFGPLGGAALKTGLILSWCQESQESRFHSSGVKALVL